MALQRLEQIVREKQMEADGILPPEAIRKAAKSPLQEHLVQYVADLTALKRDDQLRKSRPPLLLISSLGRPARACLQNAKRMKFARKNGVGKSNQDAQKT
jgi:hypothetical protein